jgi:polyhydroxyalkanoate synthesis regulator phasin
VVYKNGNAYVQNRLGIGTKDPQSLLQVVSDGDLGEIMVSASAINQSSQLFLSEGPAGNYGMKIFYDGEDDQLKIFGKRSLSTYGPWLVINRNDGEVRMPQVYDDQVGATYGILYIDDEGKIGHLTSSRRYKKNIRNMEEVNWLYKLRPVNFVYKDDEIGIKQYGLIAEEVEKVNSSFVSYNKKGQVETVSYDRLITPMLKALQEQKERIDRLEKENAALQARLEKIKKEKSELAGLKKEVEELKQILGAMTEK